MEQSLLYPRITETRRTNHLDGMWDFQFDPKEEGLQGNWISKLPKPIKMPVPASFNDFFTDKYSREYTGDFWYSTDFFVPQEWSGMQVLIRFASVTHRARIFVNGAEIISHEGGFLPFNADVTDIVRYNHFNHLAVLANNELSETTLPAGTVATLPDGNKMSMPYFDFYNYAGIHRPVTLVALPKESVQDYTVSYELNGTDAIIDYTVKTNGGHPVAVKILDAEGIEVAAAEGTAGKITVNHAYLWQVRNSYLYTICIQIRDGEQIIDSYCEKIGIRTFAIKDGHFLLNGSPVYLRGFGKHEDADIRGKGLDLATVKRDYECMKWIGANCFRTSHYPYAEELYQMADEEGFLVIDEVPAVGFMQSTMNFITASKGTDKPVGWFEKPTTPELLKNHKQAIEDMIVRDRNHACVIAWSILNEPQCTSEGTEAYFKEVFDLAHELDPQKRPRTYAIVMMSTPETSRGWQFSDFISLNRYYGWYVMGGYQLQTAEQGLIKELEGWKQIAGDRPLIFTEYGADTYAGMHKLPSVMWSQEYQNEYMEMNHKVFDSFDFIQGELMWNFADFQTTEGIMRVDGNKKGLFTRQRQPKDCAFYMKSRWESLPLDYKGYK